MNRFRYRQVLLLVALILPSVAIAELGRRNFAREHDNNNRRLNETQNIVRSLIAQKVSSVLDRIKDGVRAASSRAPGTPSDPALILVASVVQSNGHELLAGHFSASEFGLLNKDPEFARPIADASRLERALDYKSAADGFHEVLNRVRAREGTAADAFGRLEKHIHDLTLIAGIQTELDSLKLNPEEWKPYGKDGLWLSRTSDDSGPPLVIAVRGQDIVRQVQDDLQANGNAIAFRITSDETASPVVEDRLSDAIYDLLGSPVEKPGSTLDMSTGQPLGRRFPGLQIIFDAQEIVQYELAVQQRFYYTASFAFVLGLTLLGWHLLLRDSLREASNTELRAQFVSNVAHELKTPLTAIRTFAETLQIRSATDPKTQKEFLDTIVSESERLTRLLKNVLDFSLIERGQRTYRLKPARLAEVAQSAARTMQFPLFQQGFDFHVDIVDDFPPIPVDRDALEQVILNLLSNAMKYSGESRKIALRLRSDNGSALIQVVDHGIGIAPEERKRIFERYYRVASPENGSIAGSGLGLALIVHVVEGHGGTVEVESALGAGSTFSIRIPFNGNGDS